MYTLSASLKEVLSERNKYYEFTCTFELVALKQSFSSERTQTIESLL